MGMPIPANEAARLAALEGYDILDTQADPAFDRITRMASKLLGMPIAVVSLVDEDRQWFKSRVGLDAEETSREVAFCAHAIVGEGVMVVCDATRDPRFADNPLVNGAPRIRFYAGAPLKTRDGLGLGALCVIDRVPRDLDDDQKALLSDLASMVMDEMDLRRLACTDGLTGALNRRHLMELSELEVRRARRYEYPVSVAMMDVDEFKKVNDHLGHAAGDDVLRTLTRRCQEMIREQDLFGRYGGEEFAIVMPHATEHHAQALAERIRDSMQGSTALTRSGAVAFTVSVGVTACRVDDETFEDALKRADKALYRAKSEGRNRVIVGAGTMPRHRH